MSQLTLPWEIYGALKGKRERAEYRGERLLRARCYNEPPSNGREVAPAIRRRAGEGLRELYVYIYILIIS